MSPAPKGSLELKGLSLSESPHRGRDALSPVPFPSLSRLVLVGIYVQEEWQGQWAGIFDI